MRGASSDAKGTDIVLQGDAAKVKPGLRGNLIVNVFGERTPAAGDGKAKANRQRVPLGTLPALPFEVVKPASFPHTDREIDRTVEAGRRYFKEKDPRQISEDRSEDLERLFDVLEVQYVTTAEDCENFPPMPQGQDDATYGVH